MRYRNKKEKDLNGVKDFRHEDARRKNNPPAGLAQTYELPKRKTVRYAYDPHLDPQLIWAGKSEHTSFEVDVVSLHIHERISTKAVFPRVKTSKRSRFDLFTETRLSQNAQMEFYKHEMDWEIA